MRSGGLLMGKRTGGRQVEELASFDFRYRVSRFKLRDKGSEGKHFKGDRVVY